MAKFTNVSGEPLTFGYGFPGLRRVEADGVLDVPDEAAAAYDGQPEVWRRVAPAPPPAAAAAAVPIPVEAPAAPKEN